MRLLLIIVLSILVRIAAPVVITQPDVSQTYVDLAKSIRSGQGYVQITPLYPVTFTSPAYAYLLAAGLDWLPPLLDAVFGPALLWLMLSHNGYRRASYVAALGYAMAVPIASASRWILPDALTVLLCLCVVSPLIIWRDKRGALVSGLALGLAGWFRGDSLLLLPLLAMVVWMLWGWRNSLTYIAAWAVPTIILGLFWLSVTGIFSVSRPGTGLLLWQGLGQTANQWGIEARDEAAIAFIDDHNLAYGTAAGDGLLLREYVSHATQSPLMVLSQITERSRRVVTLQDAAWGNYILDQLLSPLLLILAGVGFYVHRRQPMTWVFVMLWLSRIVPFSIMRDEPRFVLPALVVYIVGTAMLFERNHTRTQLRIEAKPH